MASGISPEFIPAQETIYDYLNKAYTEDKSIYQGSEILLIHLNKDYEELNLMSFFKMPQITTIDSTKSNGIEKICFNDDTPLFDIKKDKNGFLTAETTKEIIRPLSSPIALASENYAMGYVFGQVLPQSGIIKPSRC